MATYYGTYGQKVQYLASDPSDPQTGQVWYNSTSATLKVRAVSTSGTWASGGNVNNARYGAAQAGTQTAAIIFGGLNTGGNNTTVNESYNGTSWTAGPLSLNTSRMGARGAGPQTASIIYAGDQFPSPRYSVATETWDGTSFTTQPSMSTARSYVGQTGSGTQTAVLAFGGNTGGGFTTASESYNGSWTNTPSLNTTRGGTTGAGTQTAALCFSGNNPPATFITATESWNGSAWTTLPASINTGRVSASGTGLQTAALVYSGNNPGYTGATEAWNGTSWTTQGSMGTARATMSTGNSGTTSSALAVSGEDAGGIVANTEEYTGPGTAVTQTVTVS